MQVGSMGAAGTHEIHRVNTSARRCTFRRCTHTTILSIRADCSVWIGFCPDAPAYCGRKLPNIKPSYSIRCKGTAWAAKSPLETNIVLRTMAFSGAVHTIANHDNIQSSTHGDRLSGTRWLQFHECYDFRFGIGWCIMSETTLMTILRTHANWLCWIVGAKCTRAMQVVDNDCPA